MKKIVKIVAFCTICITLFIGFTKIYFYKNYGNWNITKLYDLPKNSVDVLAAGDSHMLTTTNPAIIWNEQGIASYTVSSEGQDIWITYHNLVEALKTQHPELIMVDVHNVVNNNEYSNDAAGTMAILGMKPSWNKVQSIKAAVPSEKFMSYFLEYPVYHNRYRGLSKKDFLKDYGDVFLADIKGYRPMFITNPPEYLKDVSNITEVGQLAPKMEEYLRKIIELAKQKQIPLMLMVAPYWLLDEEQQMIFNRVEEIAAEYDVDYVNFNLNRDEIGLIPDTDYADPHHLNYMGAEKFSSYLGEYLKEQYGLTDHRGDGIYATWDKNYVDYTQLVADSQLDMASVMEEYLKLASSPQYTVILAIRNIYVDGDDPVQKMFEFFGINDASYHNYGCWVIQDKQTLHSIKWGSDEVWQGQLGKDDFQVSLGFGQSPEIIFDGRNYIKIENGVNIFVYNNYRKCVASSAGFDVSDGCRMIK